MVWLGTLRANGRSGLVSVKRKNSINCEPLRNRLSIAFFMAAVKVESVLERSLRWSGESVALDDKDGRGVKGYEAAYGEEKGR